VIPSLKDRILRNILALVKACEETSLMERLMNIASPQEETLLREAI
jgi:hypothetical protein